MPTNSFVVSAADFAFEVDGLLAATGTTNLNTSIEVSMQEQNVNAGKGSKLVFSYKYGRELMCTLEAANWELGFIAMQTGTLISEGAQNVYALNECVQLSGGSGSVANTPVGTVHVQLPSGTFVTVTPTAKVIDLTSQGLTTEAVKVTYAYSKTAKTLVIDSETSPMTGKLILDGDKFTNESGKVGTVQIEIPSYQLDGNFTISFTPDGVTSTQLSGKALAVEGDECSDGKPVYAYIHEFEADDIAIEVNALAALPNTITMAALATQTITVYGLKGGNYKPVLLDNADCTFASSVPAKATVNSAGLVTGVAAGDTVITVSYGDLDDTIPVTITA